MFKLVAKISKFFAALLILLKRSNYFDSLTKLFSDLYLPKFLDTSTKMFFSMYAQKNDEKKMIKIAFR